MNTNIVIKVSVPFGDYCVNDADNHNICPHFDNEGGHPTCDISRILDGYDSLYYDKMGNVPKLPTCLKGGNNDK